MRQISTYIMKLCLTKREITLKESFDSLLGPCDPFKGVILDIGNYASLVCHMIPFFSFSAQQRAFNAELKCAVGSSLNPEVTGAMPCLGMKEI